MKGGIVCLGVCLAGEEIDYLLSKIRFELQLQKEIWESLAARAAQETEEKLPEKQVFNLCQKILNLDQKEIGRLSRAGASLRGFARSIGEPIAKQIPAAKIDGGLETDDGRIFSSRDLEILYTNLETNPYIWCFLVDFLSREIYDTNNKGKVVKDRKLFGIGVKIIMALDACTEETAIALLKTGGPLWWPSRNGCEKIKQIKKTREALRDGFVLSKRNWNLS